MESSFWVWPLPEKSEKQIKLETQVFGCDDLWRYIKTFIFSPKKCRYDIHFNGRGKSYSNILKTPCHGELSIDEMLTDIFMHMRQGISEEKRVLGRFRLLTYNCEAHKGLRFVRVCCIT